MVLVVAGWILSLSVVIFTSSQTVFWIMGPFIGICLGSTWTASRPLLTGLIPRETLGQFFGLYALAGKVAAVLGPLLWGLTVLYCRAENPIVRTILSSFAAIGFDLSERTISTIQYRFAVFVLVLMMIVGFIILLKVPDRFERRSELSTDQH
jgi:MFS-type transporter involved in bile tolerance (Atg22 family)